MRATKLRLTLTVLTVGVLAVLVAWLVWRGAGQPRIFPPQSRPYGKSYGQWSALWWQWVSQFPVPESPLFGSRCPDVGQSGEVWFLAGTSEGTVVRACTVPAGKALFFPVANTVSWNSPGESYTEQELGDRAAQLLELAKELACTIDGTAVKDLDRFRVLSPAFDLHLPENNIHGEVPGDYSPAVSDGWWIMLEPLPQGQHEIHFYVVFQTKAGDLIGEVDVTYHLTVR